MTRNNKQINKNKFAIVKAGGAEPRPYEASKEYCKNRKRSQALEQRMLNARKHKIVRSRAPPLRSEIKQLRTTKNLQAFELQIKK